jgi:hypothetical protein
MTSSTATNGSAGNLHDDPADRYRSNNGGLGLWCERWANIFWYHSPRQLLGRAVRIARDRFSPGRVRKKIDGASWREEDLPWSAPLEHPITDVDRDDFIQFSRGRLRLLNLSQMVNRPINWRHLDRRLLPPLWMFHLHYHDYLRRWLAIAGAEAIVAEALTTWLDEFGEGGRRGRGAHSIAWHPYVISRRVFAWSALLVAGSLEEALRQRMAGSLASQVDWLDRHLEWDIAGNHLWSNGASLALAGCLFSGTSADRWWGRGQRILNDCIESQLSPVGEHFERSPAYQSELASQLAELACWGDRRDSVQADRWCSTSLRMKAMVDRLRHPDGSCPLFGDSTFDCLEMKSSGLVDDRSEWVGEYYVHRRDGDALIFDAGEMAADSLPAHGHADLLGFELSLKGERVFVDRGVFAYSGSARQEYRSSMSHNVLTIDGEELADVWSSFRMGRRGHVVERKAGFGDAGVWISAAHDAFGFLGVRRVERYWFLANEGPWFCWDFVRAGRSRTHVITSRLWLAENLRMKQSPVGWKIAGESSSFHWSPMGEGIDVRVFESTRSNRFYRADRCLVISLTSRIRCDGIVGWMVSGDPEPVKATIEPVDGVFRLRWQSSDSEREVLVPMLAPTGRRRGTKP